MILLWKTRIMPHVTFTHFEYITVVFCRPIDNINLNYNKRYELKRHRADDSPDNNRYFLPALTILQVFLARVELFDQ